MTMATTDSMNVSAISTLSASSMAKGHHPSLSGGGGKAKISLKLFCSFQGHFIYSYDVKRIKNIITCVSMCVAWTYSMRHCLFPKQNCSSLSLSFSFVIYIYGISTVRDPPSRRGGRELSVPFHSSRPGEAPTCRVPRGRGRPQQRGYAEKGLGNGPSSNPAPKK